MIPIGRQYISENDISAVEKVLRSDFLTQGNVVSHFEDSVAQYCGSSFGIAVNSATSALHISCMALDLKKGDYLWTTPNTFVASANCALYCNANVDFVDINPSTYNMCINNLEKKLEQAKINDRLPKIVIPVHYAGQPCEMKKIFELSQIYGFKIIEDASHAIGAIDFSENTKTELKNIKDLRSYKIGSCKYSDLTVFSFHPVKIITTGEGGMIVTNKERLADRLKRLRTHGITRDKSIMKKRNTNEIWNYQQIELGYNYRMTEIQAALGLSQLEKIDEFINKRHKIAVLYSKYLKDLPIILPLQRKNTFSSFHLYPIRINRNFVNIEKKELYNYLLENEIGVNIHYIPVHMQPFYEAMGFKKGQFPESESFYHDMISLPIYYQLNQKEQEYICSKIRKFFKTLI